MIFYSDCSLAAPEYNVWYAKDGIYYDVTQTSDATPVLISFTSHPHTGGGMIITFSDKQNCSYIDNQMPIKIDFYYFDSKFSCYAHNNYYILTYTITDEKAIDYVFSKLKKGFTVVFIDDIKVWASNINHPLYGVGSFVF